MCFICAANRVAEGQHKDHINASVSTVQENLARLSVAESTAGTAQGNLSQYIDTLNSGRTWTGTVGESATVRYSFDLSAVDTVLVQADEFSAFSASQQSAAINAMNSLSTHANVTFEQTSSDKADLHFYNGDIGENFSGIASYFFTDSTLTSVAVGMDDQYQDYDRIGTFSYETLLHEIGHAVGLKHPGNYSASDDGPFLPTDLDNTELTVMSYNEVGSFKTDFQPLDIAALQYMYGENGNSLSGLLGSAPAQIVDGMVGLLGGYISASGDDGINSLIASRAAEIKGGLNSDSLAGSGENDTLYGGRAIADLEDSADILAGNGGHDALYGNQGNDVIYGDDQAGQLAGNDTIYGGRGEDSIYGGHGDDWLAGGGGIAHPEDEADWIEAGSGNDTIISNGSNDTVYGEAGNDTIWGGLGDDIILGGDGDDFIAGQDGNEALSGGNGADIFFFGGRDGTDIITDFDPSRDRLQIVSNINQTGIYNASDWLGRLTSQDGYTVINMGDGNEVYLQVAMHDLALQHFEMI